MNLLKVQKMGQVLCAIKKILFTKQVKFLYMRIPVYVIVIPWLQGILLIYTPESPRVTGLRA